jgi:hypothetical protein
MYIADYLTNKKSISSLFFFLEAWGYKTAYLINRSLK